MMLRERLFFFQFYSCFTGCSLWHCWIVLMRGVPYISSTLTDKVTLSIVINNCHWSFACYVVLKFAVESLTVNKVSTDEIHPSATCNFTPKVLSEARQKPVTLNMCKHLRHLQEGYIQVQLTVLPSHTPHCKLKFRKNIWWYQPKKWFVGAAKKQKNK